MPMDEKRPVGRPPRKCETKKKFFNIRIDLAKKLETYLNQTAILEEALELHFNLDDESNQHLIKTREKLKRELNSINSIIDERKRKEKQEQIMNEREKKELEKEYQRFCNRLEQDIEFAEMSKSYFPSVSAINKSFGMKLTGKEYQGIVCDYRKEEFNLKDFEKLRRSNDA